MFRVLKAEIYYNKYIILISYFLSFVCFNIIWYEVKWERNRNPMTMLIMLCAVIVISFVAEKKRSIQKWDRLYITLPIILQRLGVMHLLFPFILWFGIVVLYYFAYFLAQSMSSSPLTIPSFLQILTLNGLILCVDALYLINRNLQKTLNNHLQKFIIIFIWLCTYIAALLPFYIITNIAGMFGENTSLQIFLDKMTHSPFWINIIGIALSVISYFQFLRRKSYIEA